ncbi:hypothetical protein ACQKKK_23605 [Peribacillus sp. NPDC006672]|uniref:hypothetical protein n=1 Tax=Peribacillus TaxID=2675229 RepID=UPI0006F466ED|nr:hypothetical protein ASG65_27030 [Bacillus sp. Leaf13]
MRVHHSGALSKEYFYAYMKLILATRTSSFEEMRQMIETHFFKGDLNQYGAHTRTQYKLALHQIEDEINK